MEYGKKNNQGALGQIDLCTKALECALLQRDTRDIDITKSHL